MNLSSKFLLILTLILGLVFSGYSQEKRKKYEKEKKELIKEIEYKNKLLGETKKSRSASYSQLKIIRAKIADREKLIQTLRREVTYVDQQIAQAKRDIRDKESELKLLKEEYARMILNAYKTRSSYDKLMYVFASENFNQAYKRLEYLTQYSNFRQRQAEMIVEAQKELAQRATELEEKKIEKELVIQSKEKEKYNLDADRTEKQRTFNDLKSKEKELKKEIQKKEKEKKKIDKIIAKLIRDAIKNPGPGGYTLTPEAKALSANFASNKGKLPWPTAKGVVTEYFGRQNHPDLPGVVTNNNGIDLTTEKGAAARAVFKGKVTHVIVLPGAGKAVMIRHGEYYSVYSNLSEVYVQKGDEVDLKQAVGRALTDDSKGVTRVHFEVWKGTTPMNPAGWLYKFK